jgi:hypothetical protein
LKGATHRADDEEHKRLGRERLDEPTRTEQRLGWVDFSVTTTEPPPNGAKPSFRPLREPSADWPQCARKNVCQDVGRSGTGGMPAAFKIRAIVERPTRCPTFFNAPWIRV